jgi:hypothetical protein
MFSADERYAVFNGFWWASSASEAEMVWQGKFSPPLGCEITAVDTMMIPRSLLDATTRVQRIGRTSVQIGLFALAGVTIDARGRHTAYASYIRASSPEMALNLWQKHPYGLPASQRTLAFAISVPSYWVSAVLKSPPIQEALEHDRVLRLSR